MELPMEELGDQCKVVFAGLLLESAGKYGGRGGEESAHTILSLSIQVVAVKN
jgi:hypothetical protein